MNSDEYYCKKMNKKCRQPNTCEYTLHRFGYEACKRNRIQQLAVMNKELKRRKQVNVDYDYKDPVKLKEYYNSLREDIKTKK